jgi:proteasome lid subunit RPN8/RPN11
MLQESQVTKMWGRRNENKSKKLLETRDYLVRTRTRFLALYSAAVEKSDKERMNYINKRLAETNRMLGSLGEIETELLGQQAGAHRFLISSLFLHECFKELTADSKEQFFFVTGSEADGTLVLDQKCGFAHVTRSVVGVEGEIQSTHSLLCKLEKFGHRLLAHFHSHPGHGIGSTLPSSTDREFQERLERGGYPNVAAIFSRDGFVRFFRLDHKFEIAIHGKGVEEIEPNVFRLTNLN